MRKLNFLLAVVRYSPFTKMVTIVKCPQCQKAVNWDISAEWKPFCSKRCKLIDLGDWAEGNHKIAGESAGNNDSEDIDSFTDYH